MKKMAFGLAVVLAVCCAVSCAPAGGALEPPVGSGVLEETSALPLPEAEPVAAAEPAATAAPEPEFTPPPYPDPQASTAEDYLNYLKYLEYSGYDDRPWEEREAERLAVLDSVPRSDDPMAICNLFPDAYLMLEAAAQLGKRTDDIVTLEELAEDGWQGVSGVGKDGHIESLEGIQYMTGITSLVCGKSVVRELPRDLGKLENLESITILLCPVEELPASVGELKKLKSLEIQFSNITEIPEEIGGCESLEYLRVSDSDIGRLPDSVCELTKLTGLSVGRAGITALPEKIGNLENLETLYLFGNDLKRLPKSMKKLTKLRYLNVYDNYDLDEEYKEWFAEEVWKVTSIYEEE